MKYSVFHENSNTASLLGKKAGIRAAQAKWTINKDSCPPVTWNGPHWMRFLSYNGTFKFQEQSENNNNNKKK